MSFYIYKGYVQKLNDRKILNDYICLSSDQGFYCENNIHFLLNCDGTYKDCKNITYFIENDPRLSVSSDLYDAEFDVNFGYQNSGSIKFIEIEINSSEFYFSDNSFLFEKGMLAELTIQPFIEAMLIKWKIHHEN